MERQASLKCFHLYSPDPLPLAYFYCASYAMTREPAGDGQLAFYTDRLSFVLSDAVKDPEGALPEQTRQWCAAL